jgi:hypothetical protein
VGGVDARQELLGSWQAVSWSLTDSAGTRHPFGEHPSGVLLYTPDGRMAAIVTVADRPLLPGVTPRTVADAALAEAFRSFFCYSGSWHVEGDEVVHTIDIALNPNMVGTQQRRRMSFSLGPDEPPTHRYLELSAQEPTDRGTRLHRLLWRRSL